MRIKRMIVSVLCVCMTVGLLVGCSSKLNGSDTVITVNDKNVNLGTLMMLVRYQEAYMNDYYTNMYAQYEAQGLVMNTGNLWDGEPREMSDDAETSGMKIETYGDQIVDDVAVGIASYLVTMEHADEYDISLSESEKKRIEVAVDQLFENSDEGVLAENGITKDDAVLALQWYTIYNRVYDAYADKSDIVISDDEARTISVSYMQFSINSESELYNTNALVKKQAEQVLATLSAKENMQDIDFNEFKESYTNLNLGSDSIPVNEEPEDGALVSADDVKAMSGLENGVIYDKLLSDGNGSYYIFRVENNDDKEAAKSYAESLRSDKIADAFVEILKGWTKDAKVVYNTKLLESIDVVDHVKYIGTKQSVNADDSEDTDDSGDVTSSNGVEIKADDGNSAADTETSE